MADSRTRRSTNFSIAAAVSGILALGPAHANPTNAQVVGGQAQFSGGAGSLTITNSDGAIINWQDFSVGAGEVTRFIQTGASSKVLNRVTGGLTSKILGDLVSNGQVYLINPNGIVVGSGATIDTAGLVASSLNLSDEDFAAGIHRFQGGGKGGVENRGLIHVTRGGDILMVGPRVENHGIIRSDNGNLMLAAGSSVELSSFDVNHVRFEVRAPDSEVLNLGQLVANGGAVGLFASRINTSGHVQARRVSRDDDGTIRLIATSRVDASGVLDASGHGTAGGKIDVTAANVALDNLVASVAGAGAGGSMQIGGGYQGTGSLAHAQNVTVGSGTRLNADARGSGNGGSIVVWSDQYTSVDGVLTARGGDAGGNGGLVETSSLGKLEFSGPADVSAARGTGGTWLLDPEDIIIDEARAQSISTALNGGSNVTVKTADDGTGEGNIDVNAAITKTEGPDASLTLDAHSDINVNKPITSTEGALHVSMIAGRRINVASAISTNGGGVTTNVVVPDEPTVDEGGSGNDIVTPDSQESDEPTGGKSSSEDSILNNLGEITPDADTPTVTEADVAQAADVTDETTNAIVESITLDSTPESVTPSDVIISANIDSGGGDITLAGDRIHIVANANEGSDVVVSTQQGDFIIDAIDTVAVVANGSTDVRLETGGDMDVTASSLTVVASQEGDVVIEVGGEFSATSTAGVTMVGAGDRGGSVSINANSISLSADEVKVVNGGTTGKTNLTADADVTIEADNLLLSSTGSSDDALVTTENGQVNLSGVGACDGCQEHISGTMQAPLDDSDERDDPFADPDTHSDDPVVNPDGGGSGAGSDSDSDGNVVVGVLIDSPADGDATESTGDEVDSVTGDTSTIVVALLDTNEDDEEDKAEEEKNGKVRSASSTPSSAARATKRKSTSPLLQCN